MNMAQQTSLSITLREFEVRLARLRVLLEQCDLVARLPLADAELLRQMIDRQQAIIDDLFHRLQLKRETIDVVQTMIAELSNSWRLRTATARNLTAMQVDLDLEIHARSGDRADG
jgi:hypothetical protein